MSFSVNTNINSMTANLYSNKNDTNLQGSVARLSSGSKLNAAADGAASLSIANRFSAQVSSMGQEIMNANDSIGMIHIADGALSGVNDNMDRIRELTLKASNGTMNSDNRASIQKEIDSLLKSSNQMVKSASYNGIALLDGSSGSLGDANFSNNLSIDVTTESGLSSALNSIDGAKGNINKIRSDLGASENKFGSQIRNTSLSQINAASAESQLRDVDFATESANFSKENLMSQISAFSQAQANTIASNAMRLLN
jgi:flagellin